MLLQEILEGLGLGGFAGSCLCCGHLQRGCWDGASLQPGGAAAVREAGTYNTREDQAKFSDFQSRLHSRLYQLCAGLCLWDKWCKGLCLGFLAVTRHLVRYEFHGPPVG